MTWTEILAHVRSVDQCNENDARRQIGNAIAEHKLRVKWADERKDSGPSGPNQAQSDEPPRDSQYWQECKTDPENPDLVLEPAPYDRELVSRRTAARLDNKRRPRKPMFQRDQVLLLWPQTRSSATAADENKAINFLKGQLETNKNLGRDQGFKLCKQQFRELSKRGFRLRVWPQAREAAGLQPNAPAGRKPKQK